MKPFLISLLFIGILCTGKSQEEVPALVSLDIYEQADTLGFNLVSSIPALLYDGVHNGSITLWDSPKKEINMSGSFLKQLEEANQTDFSIQHYIFLHEVWYTNKRETMFRIVGFSFVGMNKADSTKFNYGYIEMKEIENLLRSNFIPVNINGYYQTTYYDALYHRDYEFNLLQLGPVYFKDYKVALKNKNKYFNPKKKIITYNPLVQRKFVACRLDSSICARSADAQELLNAFTAHYTANREEFLNAGGDKIFSHLQTRYPVVITRVEFSSVWRKEKRFIYAEPDYLLVYAGNVMLDTLYMKNLDTWEEQVSFKRVAQIIRDNAYDVLITQINETPIDPQDSKRFLEALRYYPWHKTSEYFFSK